MITIKDLKKAIKGLPKEMKVVLGIGESLEDICVENIEVLPIKFNDSDEEEILLVLPICTCHVKEPELGEINSQPELN